MPIKNLEQINKRYSEVPHICNLMFNLSFEINQLNSDNIVDPKVKASGMSKKNYHVVIHGKTYKECQENLLLFTQRFESFIEEALKNEKGNSNAIQNS